MSLAPQRGGSDPSPACGPKPQSFAAINYPSAGEGPVSYLDHLLPWEKEKLFLGRRRRPPRILFPLPGERVARAARFHQRARVG